MTVTLDVIEDDETCTVFAGIVITSPARPERGTVILDDDGWIHWECDAGDIPGGLTDLADTLADILTPESRPTARDLLAVAYSACLRAITSKQTRTAAPSNGTRGHHE